jgi:hypothetical protein
MFASSLFEEITALVGALQQLRLGRSSIILVHIAKAKFHVLTVYAEPPPSLHFAGSIRIGSQSPNRNLEDHIVA